MKQVLEYLDKSIATYAADPPDSEYQRGCLDTLKIARSELAVLLDDQTPLEPSAE